MKGKALLAVTSTLDLGLHPQFTGQKALTIVPSPIQNAYFLDYDIDQIQNPSFKILLRIRLASSICA